VLFIKPFLLNMYCTDWHAVHCISLHFQGFPGFCNLELFLPSAVVLWMIPFRDLRYLWFVEVPVVFNTGLALSSNLRINEDSLIILFIYFVLSTSHAGFQYAVVHVYSWYLPVPVVIIACVHKTNGVNNSTFTLFLL